MMNGRFMIEKPDDIDATLKVTMTIKEWCELRDQLAQKYPSSRLSIMITNLLSQARKVHYEEQEAV